jgi:hypothetical protein
MKQPERTQDAPPIFLASVAEWLEFSRENRLNIVSPY